MNTFWMALGSWWLQAMLSGGAVLLLGWLVTLALRAPGLRQKVAAWAVRGAVLAAVLSALPQWMLLPRPGWMANREPAVTATAQTSPEEPLPPPVIRPTNPDLMLKKSAPAPRLTNADAEAVTEPEPVEWVFIPRERVHLSELAVAPVEAIPTPPTEGSVPIPTAADNPLSPADVVPLLLSAYAVVAGWLLLQLVWEWLALAWLLRDAAPLVGRARWVLDRLTVDERCPRAVASSRIRSPFCVGFFRPLVVLPKQMADTADEPTLRWVLAHELDHLRRGDTRTAHWVGIARAMFFVVPWFWILRRDLNLCQEFLADAAAAGEGKTPADYAAFLVDLSGGRGSRRPIAAARMRAGKSDLFWRVNMLLNVKTAAREVSRGFAVVAGTAAVATAVGLSGIGFADEPKQETPKRVEEKEVAKPNRDVPFERTDVVKPVRVVEPVEDRVIERRVADTLVPVRVKAPVEVDVVRPVMRMQPPIDVVRQAPRVVTGVDNDLRAQYERQLKEFEETIKKSKDPEAKEQLEKARDEYKKAMEEPLKKADAARKDLDAARKKLDEANRFQNNDEALRRLQDLQKRMELKLMEDLKRFEGFQQLNPDDFKQFEQMFGGGRGFMVGPDGLFAPVQRSLAHPRLGLKIDKVPSVLAEQLDLAKDTGVVIADVTAGSPAEKAGLKKNDVLLKLADREVPTDAATFAEMVNKLKAGEKIDAVVLRKGKKETVKGIELPEPKKSARGDFERGGLLLPAGGGGANESVQIQINNDDVTLNGSVDGVAYTITGAAEKGKLVPSKIVIKEGKESKEYESLDKVPETQRTTVERLMGKVRVFGK